MTELCESDVELVNDVDEFRALKREWQNLPLQPFVANADRCKTYRVAGFDVTLLMRGEQSAGRAGAYLMRGRKGGKVPPHHQTNEEEHFFIIDGEWEFLIGTETHKVGAGHFLFAPRMCQHAFELLSETGSLLSWNSPAGHERFFREMVPLIEAGKMDQVAVAAPKYETIFS
jgi:mannose-6-phosphate isomerase-like protein (cupin superfamily)